MSESESRCEVRPAYLRAMRQITGLARILDMRYPSNRVAVLVTLAAAIVGFVAGENRVSAAISLAGASFLGWTIAREIDPDRPLSASISAPIAGVVAWIDLDRGHAPALGAIFLTLVATRVLVRSTGRPPTVVDLVVNLGVVAWLSSVSLAWAAGVALAVAIVLDTRMEPPAPPRNLWFGALIGAVATVAAGILWEPPLWTAPATAEWVPMVIGLTGALFLVRPEAVRSYADDGSGPILPHRLTAARLLAAVTAVVTALMGGAAGVAAMGPIWVALGVAGVIRIVSQTD